jgi:hypothetical protein
MNYFLDTEFIEGPQTKRFLGIPYGKTKPTIDLISIALTAEDNSSLYLICKDFNLKEAWDRYDEVINRSYPFGPEYNKVYWIRNNVLKTVFSDLLVLEEKAYKKALKSNISTIQKKYSFNYRDFKKLLNKHGKTKEQIAESIKIFTHCPKKPKFYAYYADYDWVVFCWLFGNMINLPKDFPMYCIDLKQMYDEKNDDYKEYMAVRQTKFGEPKKELKLFKDYPQQENEHNALADAKWNKKLYDFLNKKHK